MTQNRKISPPISHRLFSRFLLILPPFELLLLFYISNLYKPHTLYSLPENILLLTIFFITLSIIGEVGTYFVLIPITNKKNYPLKIFYWSLNVVITGGSVISLYGSIIGIFSIRESYVYWWIIALPFFIVSAIFTLYYYINFFKPSIQRAQKLPQKKSTKEKQKESTEKYWKDEIKKHWKVLILFVAAMVIFLIIVINMLLWVVTVGVVPILWEFVFVGIPAALMFGIIGYIWWESSSNGKKVQESKNKKAKNV